MGPRCVTKWHLITCVDDNCRGCLPRYSEIGQLCTRCFNRLDTTLGQISVKFQMISEDDDLLLPERGGRGGRRRAPGPRDVLRLDTLDLLLRAPGGSVDGPASDQIGQVPVLVILGSWCREFADLRGLGERAPYIEVHSTVMWLRHRLEWAAKYHPAVADFVTEMRQLQGRLSFAIAGERQLPLYCKGVPCQSCDLLTLYRRNDGTGDVECHNPNCRSIFSLVSEC